MADTATSVKQLQKNNSLLSRVPQLFCAYVIAYYPNFKAAILKLFSNS